MDEAVLSARLRAGHLLSSEEAAERSSSALALRATVDALSASASEQRARRREAEMQAALSARVADRERLQAQAELNRAQVQREREMLRRAVTTSHTSPRYAVGATGV